MSFFPLFTDISGKTCLIYGGGKVAFRKVQVLLDFGAEIVLAAPEIIPGITNLAKENPQKITLRNQCFDSEDFEAYDPLLVIAATDDAEENHKISVSCKERKIPINAVDQPEDCTFIFPAYIKKGEVVGAFSSGGQSPVITQYLKKEMAEILTDQLGQISEYLGSIRPEVRQMPISEAEKREIYQKILMDALDK